MPDTYGYLRANRQLVGAIGRGDFAHFLIGGDIQLRNLINDN